ncbi:TPR repeat-containing protein 03 [Orientia tsutsugamushi]|nr:TPR repeat family protein [Orientia tsutsugamushi str. TA763]SPP25248.1 TPR repeat-containing protein 03 [Orientia tsutsugamushi]
MQNAIEHFDLAIKYDHNDATAYCVLSMLKKYPEAIKSCNFAIKYAPNCADSYYIKGMVFEKLGKHQKAIKNYDIAISTNLILLKIILKKEFH